jgi:prepilin-type N-terminal cleavage/methylation domain-containing protein
MEKKLGFTLIELIIVIVVMVVLSAYAVARWPGNHINLNAQAQQLANQLRYTQSLAFSQNQRYRLNLTSTSYNITTTGSTAVADPVTGSNATNLPSGITMTWSAELPNALVAFDSKGSPYTDSSATTLLANDATIRLTQGSTTRTVLITPQTGRVIVQ